MIKKTQFRDRDYELQTRNHPQAAVAGPGSIDTIHEGDMYCHLGRLAR
jgi:hypothetical protein